MNAETIHDALTLLPEELIAETDALRRRPKRIPWKRPLATAACIALLLLGTLALPERVTERAYDEAAPQLAMDQQEAMKAPAEAAEGADSIALPEAKRYAADQSPAPLTTRCSPAPTDGMEASVVLISAREELDAYLGENNMLSETCTPYDENYFMDNQLLIQLADAPGGGEWYAEQAEDGSLTLTQRNPDTTPAWQYTLWELPGKSVSSVGQITITQAAP